MIVSISLADGSHSCGSWPFGHGHDHLRLIADQVFDHRAQDRIGDDNDRHSGRLGGCSSLAGGQQ